MKRECRYIIDTTLRDGMQSPGAVLAAEERARVARLLDAAGVYQIEAGVPAAGEAERAAVWAVKRACRRARVAVWSRMCEEDIIQSAACAPDVIHISVPVSEAHIYEKLRRDRAWLKQRMLQCVRLARSKAKSVTVGFEDASRADPAFMAELARLLHPFDITFIRFADTVGILTPGEAHRQVGALLAAGGIAIAFHAHNDLGMAVANSVAAAQAGAAYIDTTVGGVGERAGNCPFADLVRAADLQYDVGMKWPSAAELTKTLHLEEWSDAV